MEELSSVPIEMIIDGKEVLKELNYTFQSALKRLTKAQISPTVATAIESMLSFFEIAYEKNQ